MTDVVLNTGEVFAEYDIGADPEGQSSVFGSPPQWDDASDSTFAILRAYRTSVTSFFGNAYAALIGNADGKGFLSFNVRWLPDSELPIPVKVGLRVDGTEVFSNFLSPVAGTIRNDTVVFSPGSEVGPLTWDEICMAIGEDRATVFAAILDPLPAELAYVATVYDLVVTALDPLPVAFSTPLRRKYPVPTHRAYPPPPFQSSGRTGSAAII